MVTLSRRFASTPDLLAENALETVQFLETNRIQVDPAAVKSQFQNPVEREVQTLNKGVAALLIDQSSLGPSFWDYAAESWVHTANHTTGSCSVEGRSPLEIVTGRVPDISRYLRFPLVCPSSFTRLKSAIITTRP